MKQNLIAFPSRSPEDAWHRPGRRGLDGPVGPCLREIYELVVGAFTDYFWADAPNLSLRHRIKLDQYVRKAFSKHRFVSRHRSRARRHPGKDPISGAFNDVIEGTSRAIDIYVRRFVEEDFTAPLIDASADFEEASHLAWIQEELSALEYRQLTGLRFPFARADHIYSFCAPVYAWEHGFGRSGLIVIRSERIVESVLVEASWNRTDSTPSPEQEQNTGQ